jgi:cation-transporting ATPase 13A1
MADGDGAMTKVEKKVKEVKYSFAYFRERPRKWAYDGLPFLAVYGAVGVGIFAILMTLEDFVIELFLLLLVPALGQGLLFLTTHWSVEIRCYIRFAKAKELEKATHVKVIPRSPLDRVMLVPLMRQGEEVSFLYNKKKFVYNQSEGQFVRLKFSTSRELSHYLNTTGLDDAQVAKSNDKYGPNNFDIPLPSFAELFKEHAVAPFFVFQIFCVTLWLMDDYWYYALGTLVMLIILECQMVQRRLYDISELRAMRIPPRTMHVFRANMWRAISSDKLLPGDIISLCRSPGLDANLNCPCDVLVLSGSILVNESMLTGESVPQTKVALPCVLGTSEAKEPLDMKSRHKQHVVSAGTNVVLHQNDKAPKQFKKVPSNGCVGYVLRTGFDTTQGKLVRTILFSAERVTVSSMESYLFLLVLVLFALCSCAYVIYDGLVITPVLYAEQQAEALKLEAECLAGVAAGNVSNFTDNLSDDSPDNISNSTNCSSTIDEKPRSTFKLLLTVSRIMTSVVPPEFPITLSLAVNLSLVALIKYRIFCTEPFRVPLAGKVSMCCFDKTGTLTSDVMEVDRVEGLEHPCLKEPNAGANGGAKAGALNGPMPFLTVAVMAACSGLQMVDGEVVGDPMEKAAVQSVGWMLSLQNLFVSKLGKGADRLQVLHRNPFVSELQRMSVLVKHIGPGRGYSPHAEAEKATAALPELSRGLALVKGSCETLRPMLRVVPPNFDSLQAELAQEGLRVLCLAAKEASSSLMQLSEPSREDLESDLEFCGLLVLRNPIKPHSAKVVKQLRRSYFRCTMITGDHPLTACQVATEVGLVERPFLVLEADEAPASEGERRLVWRNTARSSNGKAACHPFDGARIADLARQNALCVPGSAMGFLAEDQVRACAEYANVFARVTPQQKEQVLLAANQTMNTMMAGDGTNDVGALKHAHVGVSLLSKGGDGEAAQMDAADMEGRVPLVRLGDASIASPFTYKGDTVRCCTQILRCGRATLCTVLMMYRIMGLNSVLSAFAMSALTLDGVKLGDGQTTVESLFISACFFLVSRSNPSKKLAKQQPISSIFHWSMMLSLVLQLVVHVGVLVIGWRLAIAHRPPSYRRNLEGDFSPNLTNTVVFLLTSSMHITSFLANYEGEPFMQPYSTNKPLLYGSIFFVWMLVVTTTEVIPDLNELLSLVAFPSADFRNQILVLLAVDIVAPIFFARSVAAVAHRLRDQAAERRAKQHGLGILEDEEDEDDVDSKKKEKKHKKEKKKDK